jgi:acyl-CoA synthetase (AMP-forming)/AMP-acid ligase II
MTLFTSPLPDVAIRDVTITQALFEALEKAPDRVVLIDGPTGRQWTGAEVIAAVKSLAGGLSARGFGAGHRVALMAPNSPEFAVIFHAVGWAGGTLTTLNPTYTAAEVRHQLQDSAAEVLFTIAAFEATAREGMQGTSCRELVVIEEMAAWMGPPLAAQVPVDLDRHVFVLPYSSGTTGLPKGVMLSHRNLVVNVDQGLAVIKILPDETLVAFLPFFHIYGMNVMLNTHLIAGARLICMPRFDLPAFLGFVQEYRVRMVMAVPPVTNAMAKHPLVDQYDVSSLKVFVSAAAPLGAELSNACAARIGAMTMQGYGMTELSPISHFSNEAHAVPGSVGVTVPNTQCKIVDPEGRALGVDAEGELCIKGPQVMLGYLNNPEATARTIDAEGWLHTGDIACFDEAGQLFIRDRLKELIKVKGFQVAPAEVEAVLQSFPGVQDAAVIGVPDDEAGEVPMAFVVLAEGVQVADIFAFLAKELSHYKQPKHIEVIDAVPKSASGKILRRLLKDRVAQGV